MSSIFAKYQTDAFPHRFHGTIHIGCIAGGTPTDLKKAEAWLGTKLRDKDDIIRSKAAEIMVERGLNLDDAIGAVIEDSNLNGFKRDEHGLYIEGRQLKAAIKEAGCVAAAAGKLPSRGWGKTNKGIKSYLAEHFFVLEDRLHLGVTEPTGVMQRFVHTFRGNGIQYEEYVDDAKVDFTVVTDQPFTDKEWAMLWLTGEKQGIGATRSQGFGTYEVTRWEAA